MRKTYLLFFGICFFPLFLMGQVIQSFDTQLDSTYWNYENSTNADPAKGFIIQTVNTANVQDGAGSMQIEYSAHNIESYGGYTKIEHMAPGSQVMDWSAYDSISFWYNNTVPQDLVGRVHLRFELYEVSDVPDTTSGAGDMEFYYSFQYVLDNTPGWHEWKMPLIDGRGNPAVDEWNGEAFNRTGWAGVEGNDKLDKNKIKGFAFEFSISGAGEGDVSKGTILLDDLRLKGFTGIDVIFFNGKSWPASNDLFVWGGSSVEVAENMGATPGTNAIKWVQQDAWTGAGWNIPSTNLKAEWSTDSLRFKMKAEIGTPQMRLQLEDGTNKVGYNFIPSMDDGEWHDYNIALKDFIFFDGSTTFDTTAITVFQFLSEGNGSPGRTIYFDDMWTGDPVIDVIAPGAPTGVQASADAMSKTNLVVWQDVVGESGEAYTVYASENPITDVTAAGVEVIASGILEDSDGAVHYLFYPLHDKEVTYYYAVTCTDAFGNTGAAAFSSSGTVNTAKTVPTISLNVPTNFVADGDFSEWEDAGIMPFDMSPETNKIGLGTVTDADDLTGKLYFAIDDNFLYIAADVIDDVYNWGAGDWWTQDVFQLFIGLYDSRAGKHKSYQSGAEPDYIMYFNEQVIRRDTQGKDLYVPGDNYYFEGINPDYVFEAKISLDSLAFDTENRFHPVRGMRIPIELYFHDNDGVWEGNLAYSFLNTDNAHNDPRQWGYTWIGDTNVVISAIDDKPGLVAESYELKQNYPNPFNPETTIEYTISKASKVKLSIFNLLGQEVEVLINSKQSAGTYRAKFNAANYTSGVYFYKIEADNFTKVRKMLLVK